MSASASILKPAQIFLGAALLIASMSAKADEYADVDPERLAQGVEILATAWTIPTVVFMGATDEFAEDLQTLAETRSPLSSSKPVTEGVPSSDGKAFDFDYGLEGLFAEIELEALLGAIERRRRVDD